MSYLGYPRLHFAGRFQADPSTVNNDPSNYDLSATSPAGLAAAGGWNPNGTGAWRLADSQVTKVVYEDGTGCDDPAVDPAVGASVNDANLRVAGKIVDLDPDQQGVSELWGFQVLVGDPPEQTGFRSTFATAPFSDIWMRCPSAHGDACFGALYQSVLTDLRWGDALASRALRELAAAGGRLSIRLSVDGFDPIATSPTFTFGRLVGAIGPAGDGEPQHFVAGRRLRPADHGPLASASCVVDGRTVRLDLANSLPTVTPGGALMDVGRLALALLPPGEDPVPIGHIAYRTAGWYEIEGGIQTFELKAKQTERATSTPLGVVVLDGDGKVASTALAENAEGAYVRADRIVFRLDPEEWATTTLVATRFGRPAPQQPIELRIDNSQVESPPPPGAPPPPRAGVPTDAVAFEREVTTDEHGRATVAITGHAPGNPRGPLDGQVYGVRYDWGGLTRAEYRPEAANVLAVRVFGAVDTERAPTWVDDVGPIFRQYALMYPVMKRVLDLSDYTSVVSNRDVLAHVFELPLEHPNAMPVTRDLSVAKRKRILAWLQDPVYLRIDTVEDLRRALQTAVELEHSTLPPYLCALFSIKDGTNFWPATIIRSVAREEMLHMALACNILNAVGGRPRIDHPSFVPRYPGPMPGGLRPYLTVRLRKASLDHIRDVFMGIEEPERTVEPDERHRLTIGWFYSEISRALERLDADGDLFTGDPARQLTAWRGRGDLIAVHDLESARAAIAEIVEQGEGASPRDPGAAGELAHFYRFEEIVRGRKLVDRGETFDFTGDPVPFDPDGIWPMRDDPDTSSLPAGSYARRMSEQFDALYRDLLRTLERVFDGRPEELGDAIGLMYAVEVAGKGLMEIPAAPGAAETVGPSFGYPAPPPPPSGRRHRRKGSGPG